jgi:mannose-6-phosphate isomerase-like protein (cupin superfamily)
VVETLDSVLVSDLEHSRDVKSIVADLKQIGRSEYHRHRSVSFPWGNRTQLEENESVKIVRLILNPGARMDLDAIPDSIHHLVVVEGVAKITGRLKSQILRQGKSAVYTNPIGIRIKNPDKRPLALIQIQLISSR